MRRCRLLTLFLTFLATFACAAAEVTAEDAAKAVGNWRVRKGQLGLSLGRTVRDSRRVEFNGAKFNIVRMEGDSCFLRVAIPENPVSNYDARLK